MFNASIPATMVSLTCPHCGVTQVRARQPADEPYECRHCYKTFTRDEGAVRGAEQNVTGGRRGG